MIAYPLHFILVDLPLKKTPIVDWALYRFILGAMAAFGFCASFSKSGFFARNYRVCLAVCGATFVAMQARSMIWRIEVPYFYTMVIAAISSVALRKSVFASLAYLTFSYLFCLQAWSARDKEIPYIISMTVVSYIFVAVVRNRMSTDVTAFIAVQAQLETQMKLIESQQELNDEIEAFLPKELYRRVVSEKSRSRSSLLQAMDEILRSRKVNVTCLYSDMRRYTQLSKIPGFIENGAIASQKASTNVVSDFHGIPSLVGDLLFAFFEGSENAPLDALLCAMKLTEANSNLNQSIDPKYRVVRYALLSFGSATVGNIGGTESSREFTVMGEPANILSRVDEMTKKGPFASLIKVPSIIMTNEYVAELRRLGVMGSLVEVNLSSLNLAIRDYEDQGSVFILPVTEETVFSVKTLVRARMFGTKESRNGDEHGFIEIDGAA